VSVPFGRVALGLDVNRSSEDTDKSQEVEHPEYAPHEKGTDTSGPLEEEFNAYHQITPEKKINNGG
jgi:hypothetical protein